MPGIEVYNVSGCQIHNIQQQPEASLDLRAEIEAGLSAVPPSLPSLLLWDEEGLRRFDKFAHGDAYYLREKEVEILQENIAQITASIPSGSVLVELGCGSLQKTVRVLSALEKQQKAVRYYALDVSLRGLTENLAGLMKRSSLFRHTQVIGLLGTYDDCIAWFANQPDLGVAVPAVTFLWLGNSVSNVHHYTDASNLLAQFQGACEASQLRCRFLIAADGCEDADRVMEAYNARDPALQAFILNGLAHSNAVLGRDAFRLEDWSCESEFYPREDNLEVYYTPRRDVQVRIRGNQTVHFRRGQRIKAISSGKWTKTRMAKVAAHAGFQLEHIWPDESGIYNFYLMSSMV
ncbi:histidine-specific methyltransferase [Aspergillus ambiguus]|uniref:histidine-specific methyltransferase n=1 Tax=Aspergillus ambiguus TaxID=176160 RepID=UPI003CCE40C6